VIRIARDGRAYRLESSMTIARPRAEIFPFFADAANLADITPPWLAFRILTPQPLTIGVGTLIDYALRLHGIPIRWRTAITAWEPPERFVDEQVAGPYRLWQHEHRFEERDGVTLALDVVRYRPRGGPLAAPLVGHDLRRIFAFRQAAIARLMRPAAAAVV